MTVDEESLARVLAHAAPHSRHAEIPAELLPWVLPAAWARERLWRVRGPVEPTAVDDLRWHYALPWWRADDGRWFRLAPADHLRSPGRHAEHAARVARADLRFPLHAFRRRDRLVVLDGLHRLVRADVLGWSHVDVVVLDLRGLADLVRDPAIAGAFGTT